MKSQAIGIIGGSFDPVHFGHLHLASEVQQGFGLSEIRFIPCHQNPLKSHPPHASAKDRIQMLELAIAPFACFGIDQCEIQNEAPSYTIDTLSRLREAMPHSPLALIIASDILPRLTQWKSWRNLIDYAHLIIANRPGCQDEALDSELITLFEARKTNHIEMLHQQTAGHIFLKTLSPQPPISSTAIRHHVAHQKDISAWVPASVKSYISTHHLYQRSAYKAS